MSQAINLFQFVPAPDYRNSVAGVSPTDWDDDLRQPAVGAVLGMLSMATSVFMIVSAIRWVF